MTMLQPLGRHYKSYELTDYVLRDDALEVHGERMIKRTFDPGYRIELHQKDLNLALSNARAMKISLPNTATAQELYNSCAANGGDSWDHSAMVRALELLASHEVA
jgi:2-hydroxy-3-oxopropionate reductase